LRHKNTTSAHYGCKKFAIWSVSGLPKQQNMSHPEFFAWVQRTKTFVEIQELTHGDGEVQRTVILECRNGRCFGALHLNDHVLIHIYKDLGCAAPLCTGQALLYRVQTA
jgi:hypothetical protein